MSRRAALGSTFAWLGTGGAARGQGDPPALEVAGKPVELSVSTVSPHTVRISVQPVVAGTAAPIPSLGQLVRESWGEPVAKYRNLAGERRIKSGELTVRIAAQPLAIRVETAGGALVQKLVPEPATGSLTFQLGDGPLLGLGQGGPQFDKRGVTDRMRSGQGGFQLRTHGAKVPVQLLIGTKTNWAMFVHQPVGAFDLSGKDGLVVPANAEAALPIDVFVIGARTPAAIMTEYARITGLPEMVPLWSFGYQQSHRTLGTPEEILEEAKIFREKKLPCDAMIYLGTDFCPNGWNTHNGEFTWNEKAFPDPKKMIDQLHADHYKVVLHIVIEGRKVSGLATDPCTAPPLPSGRTPDGRWPQDRQVSCYWPAHKPLFDLGVDGWWPDQGDGLDPASRLARNRMYLDGSQMYRPNERVFALHRNGNAGMQRFGSFLWSGDVQSTWETLKTHVPVAVNTGLSGIPFWGTDIGGFVPTQDYTGEYYIRWFQFAAFNPLFRSHGREWRLHSPIGWTAGKMIGFRETPSYNPDPNELNNPQVEPICRKYLELRYRMMPYLYSLVKETCETGIPIIRALWLHYPGDAQAAGRGDEFLYGRDILVAPVVEKGAAARSLYLPAGAWYDFWTNEKVQGGREISRTVDLATIPLYVRAGAVLPMGPVKQYTDEAVDGPLEFNIYPGADGAFSLYEDDGKTFNFRKGDFMRVQAQWYDRQRRLSVRLASGSKMFGAAKRKMVGRLVATNETREAVFEGKSLEMKF